MLSRSFDKNNIQELYSGIARIYDIWAKFTESKAEDLVLDWANITDGKKILEVATGTGILLEEAALRNKRGITVGIDISPSMLARARKRLRNNPAQRSYLNIGNAYELPFRDHTFDILINNYMLDLLPESDFLSILAEYRRILKPQGVLLISTMTYGDRWYHKTWKWIAQEFPTLMTNCRPVSIKSYLLDAGFKIEKSVFLSQNTFPSEVIKALKSSPR